MTGRPEIVITTTDSGAPEPPSPTASPTPAGAASGPGHARRPSDPTLLSPILKSGRPSLEDEVAPASPTLSMRSSGSVHWGPTTLDLRNNQPDAATGASSLALLTPPASGSNRGHGRKLSNATLASADDGTVADHDASPSVALKPLASRTSDLSAGTPHLKKGADAVPAAKTQDDDTKSAKDGRGLLNPDEDQQIDLGPFQFGPVRLASLVDPKNLDELTAMGGIDGLVAGLNTDAARGLDIDSGKATGAETSSVTKYTPDPSAPPPNPPGTEDRTRVYGTNVLPSRPSKTLLQLMWLALKDKVLVLLSIAAVIAFALGLFQDFGQPRPEGEPPVDWVEGVAIMIAVLIVVLVGSVNDWQKERQFRALGEKRDERGVTVLRRGVERVVDVRAVLVGDVALLEPGEVVPCDGVLLSGHNVRCDESGATGESDAIKKVAYADMLRLTADADADEPAHTDCFLISGSKVLEGYGRYVVIAVGPRSFNGRIMMAMRGDAENTPLQLKLNDLAELIAKLGTAAGLILFVALMIRFFVQLGTGNPVRTAAQKGLAFVNILIIAVTIIVVAVPEGLPLAVTIALAFATKRMTREQLLVRVLGACETMANASVVCTDKTGTLTMNEMRIVAGSLGIHAKFVRGLAQHPARSNAGDGARHAGDFAVEQAELGSVVRGELARTLNAAIAVCSTAFADEDGGFVGSKTETALLGFAREQGWADWRATREAHDVLQFVPFSSARKAMGVVVRRGAGARVFVKGASEILSVRCARFVVVRQDAGDDEALETAAIGTLEAENIARTIIFYANQTLRTISLCYRDFEEWPPRDAKFANAERTEVDYEDLARDMTLLGVVGIEDPLRPGVPEAVAKCQRAGVAVKMCTGDNVLTARSIALQCGIYTPGGIVMEGPVFRTLDAAAMLEVVPRLQVLARSSPEDKRVLVDKLKELGEIVGVTGDGTNDGPALKTANVGFSMGIAGTEVAKEASDIILMDDNFASIVKAIMWGRAVNDAVRRFLQFQISVNITAVLITLISAVASTSETSVLSAVQLLWVNIIMDTFAALALATDPASEASLDRKPERATAPLFTVDMYKQIGGQAAYQTAIALVFHFLGARILGRGTGKEDALVVQTLVFNIFVFAQLFNSFNCRRLDNRLNIFEGMTRNWYFLGITALEFGVQVMIVFVGGAAFQVTELPGREWGISIALGFVSIPLGALLRCIPNGPTERLLVKLRILPDPHALPTAHGADASPPPAAWNYAIDRVTDSLGTFAHVRGARMRGSSFVDRSRTAGTAPPTASALLAMVPTLVASTVGARWAPAPPEGASLGDPARGDPSRSTAALWAQKIEVHPDTRPDDYAFRRWGRAPASGAEDAA